MARSQKSAGALSLFLSHPPRSPPSLPPSLAPLSSLPTCRLAYDPSPTGGDIVFFFNAFIAYATARIAVEYARLLTGPRDVSRAQTP